MPYTPCPIRTRTNSLSLFRKPLASCITSFRDTSAILVLQFKLSSIMQHCSTTPFPAYYSKKASSPPLRTSNGGVEIEKEDFRFNERMHACSVHTVSH